MTTIAFFNPNTGVSKTSLVYHLAWMFAETGLQVLTIDLNPQADLTRMFLHETRVEELWPRGEHTQTIDGAINSILLGVDNHRVIPIERISERISLLPGDLSLAAFEGQFAEAWVACQNHNEATYRTITAIDQIIRLATQQAHSDVVILDTGADLGAVTRSALLSSQYFVVPLAADILSLLSLDVLGPQIQAWRKSWKNTWLNTLGSRPSLPAGDMNSIGYVVLQHTTGLGKPLTTYQQWIQAIPAQYQESVLQRSTSHELLVGSDPNCLAILPYYHTLMPLALRARKPMFFLKPADGALGANAEAVRQCYTDFWLLADRIAERCSLTVPNQEAVER